VVEHPFEDGLWSTLRSFDDILEQGHLLQVVGEDLLYLLDAQAGVSLQELNFLLEGSQAQGLLYLVD